ncbi:hypothetical protein Tco_1045279 [Tanacetum coccineum]|uniref:Uncharacterized protein n=1 Tax=Tanacetum coccineum TaxID=301880 RepID=A0ABQ5GTD1_9ASTR
MNELLVRLNIFEANNLPRSEFIVTLLREINEIAFVPLSLSFDFVFASEIFKSLSFRLDRLSTGDLSFENMLITCIILKAANNSLDRLVSLKEDLVYQIEHEHGANESVFCGMRHSPSPILYESEIKTVSNKACGRIWICSFVQVLVR